MPNILLTYWWNGHEPGEIVETDDQTAREILGVIAQSAQDAPETAETVVAESAPETDPEPTSEPAPDSPPASESGR